MASFFLWGVIASPYQLKMQSLLDFAGHSWQRWPEQGARWSAPAMALRLARAVEPDCGLESRRRLAEHWRRRPAAPAAAAGPRRPQPLGRAGRSRWRWVRLLRNA